MPQQGASSYQGPATISIFCFQGGHKIPIKLYFSIRVWSVVVINYAKNVIWMTQFWWKDMSEYFNFVAISWSQHNQTYYYYHYYYYYYNCYYHYHDYIDGSISIYEALYAQIWNVSKLIQQKAKWTVHGHVALATEEFLKIRMQYAAMFTTSGYIFPVIT